MPILLKKIKILKYIIKKDGIRIDLIKITITKEWPTSTNIKKI